MTSNNSFHSLKISQSETCYTFELCRWKLSVVSLKIESTELREQFSLDTNESFVAFHHLSETATLTHFKWSQQSNPVGIRESFPLGLMRVGVFLLVLMFWCDGEDGLGMARKRLIEFGRVFVSCLGSLWLLPDPTSCNFMLNFCFKLQSFSL